MGALPAENRVSVEEYLGNPAYQRCEYVAGIPVELNMGGKPHAKIQANCSFLLQQYLRKHAGGYCATELPCKLMINGQLRFRLPDVAVVRNDESPEQRYLDRAPDLVVEIRSPDDSFSGLVLKMDEYFANGTKIGWVVLPEEKSVIVFTTGNQPTTVMGEESLTGDELLPGLEITLAELFV